MLNKLLIILLIVQLPLLSLGQQVPIEGYFGDHWQVRNYERPSIFKTKTEPAPGLRYTLSIDASDFIANVLPTQFGVNSNFRSGDGIYTDGIRLPMYKKANLGAFRFPAGSGSNVYFWDGNIPDSFLIDVNAIDGTKSSGMQLETYIDFVSELGGQATVVVNYFYARYGITTEGTRDARVLQAAKYAAALVHRTNVELGAGIQNWEIGNECYGGWETGFDVNGSEVTGKEYGEDFRVFAAEMKKVDPTIKVGAVMYTKDTDWNPQVMKEVQNDADFFIIHEYFTSEADASIENVLGSIDQISENVELLEKTLEANTDKTLDQFPVALTEFNMRGPHTTTMVNGLFFTQILGEVMKNNIGMSTMWVSEWKWKEDAEPKSFIAVQDPSQEDYTARPNYMPYHFYGKTFGDKMIQSQMQIQGSGLNTYASRFSSGEIGLVITNSNNKTTEVTIDIQNLSDYYVKEAHWYEVYSSNFNEGNKKFYINGETGTTVGGGPDNFDVIPPYKKDFEKGDALVLPPFSMIFIVLLGDDTTYINSPDAETKTITIIPNPATDRIRINSNNQLTAYRIFDATGKKVQNGNESIIDVSNLNTGFYIIQVETTDQIETLSFLKIDD